MGLTFHPQGTIEVSKFETYVETPNKDLLLCSKFSKTTFTLLYSCELPDFFSDANMGYI